MQTHSTPDARLMELFGTDATYRSKLAGDPSMLHRLVVGRAAEPEKTASALPWSGRLATMQESAMVAWDVGAELAKQAGVTGTIVGGLKDYAIGAAKLPFQAGAAGARAAWNTSRATKLKALPVAAGLGVAGAGLAGGAVGSKGLQELGNIASLPEGQEHVAHVLSFDQVVGMSDEEFAKHAFSLSGAWQGVKNVAPAFGQKIKGSLSAAGQAVKGGVKSTGEAIQGARQARFESGLLAKTPEGLAARSAGKVNKYEQGLLGKPQAQAPAVQTPNQAAQAKQYNYERQQSRKLTGQQRSAQRVEQVGQRFGIQPANPTQVTPIAMDKDLRRAAAAQRLQGMQAKGIQPGRGQVAPAPSPTPAPTYAAKPVVQPPPPAPMPATTATNTNAAPIVQSPRATPQARPGQPAAPATTPQVQPAPQQNVPANPQQNTQPTAQPNGKAPTGTPAQQSAQSGDAGAAAVQTPQEAGKQVGALRGALPWVAGGLGVGALGLGAGAAMLGGRGIKEMTREGDIPNTYRGYGAPVAGAASPYGYVSGPGTP